MRYIFFLFIVFPLIGFGQSVNVVPMPQQVVMGKDSFKLCEKEFTEVYLHVDDPGSTKLNSDTEINYNVLKEDFEMDHGHFFKERAAIIFFCDKPILLSLNENKDVVPGKEAYHLRIRKDSIFLSANEMEGIYRGICTITQMIISNGGKFIPCCDIVDYPSYPYRAMHLDVCRHFFRKDFVKDYIDLLSQYKINTFHWHLTDDQGWRIEIKKYTKLTEVGALREEIAQEQPKPNGGIVWPKERNDGKYGGFYTQEDIKEIVQYAKDRYITIIPEIEMPGHSSAALSAYPEFGCTGAKITVPNTWGIKKDIYAPTDTVFRFFEDVMDEVCELFPSRYIHIGGDEAPKAQWKSSAIAQAVMKQHNLKNEEELQHYFMHRVESYLNKKGRTAIGWGEVVKGGLSDSMVVMSWLSKGAGIKAAKHGNDVIMAPRGYCYFDYPQAGDKLKAIWMLPLPLRKVYAFDPMPKGLSKDAAKHILGGEATLWTEYVRTEDQVLHQLMPRMAALSEALWTGTAKRNYENFAKRLRAIYPQTP